MAEKKSSEEKSASLIVKSAIRKYVNSKECNISSEVLNDTLNEAVKKILDKSIDNARLQKRKTIKPSDVPL